jgi:beta-glucosidase
VDSFLASNALVLSIAVQACLPAPVVAQSLTVRALVQQMTLEEKIMLVHGARDPRDLGQAGYWPGLPRLGIPPLRLADGPPGVNVTKPATGMPAPIGLGATFSREAARQYGVALGREAAALEQDVLLAPHVNIIRDPAFRRNHTTFSEDPFLNAQLGAAQINGIQSQGVMAQVKHLAAYNGTDDVFLDERTLHEIYLPAFEAAVEAGVASVMCAYSKVNGSWACENGEIQNEVLRGQWGFRGFVTSDWGAVHSPLAITKGLDMEMPGREIAFRGSPVFSDGLMPLIKSSSIPVADLDQALLRILQQMERFGLLDRKPPPRPASGAVRANARIAQNIAEQGAVLLKNEGNALPLSPDDLASLAVIGPTGEQLAVGFMGERGTGFESRFVAPLSALRRTAPRADITYSVGNDLTGVPIPPSVLSTNSIPGLLRKQVSPEAGTGQIDKVMDFDGRTALEPDTEFTWTGVLDIPTEGDYTFMVQAGGKGADGAGGITIDGHPVVRWGTLGSGFLEKRWSSLLPTRDGRDNARATLRLNAGTHQIELRASSTGGAPLRIRFAWMTPELRRTNIEAAVALAKRVRTPVVFAWNSTGASLELPEGQDELIDRIVSANPRTIVVLNTGGPVTMPWKEKVHAILQMWYPGQEGGWATANVLLGRANPGGKLPVTYPVAIGDSPTWADGHPERSGVPALPGGAGVFVTDLLTRALGGLGTAAGSRNTGGNVFAATYTEGLAVGYRWYDQQKIQPLFPFGHGLSYTQFQYSDLRLERIGVEVEASFTVRNAGARQGSEVPQLYLGPADGLAVPMMPKSLVGFERIELKPGESKRVVLRLGARSLSYWSTEKHGWVVANNNRSIYVGSSSRDIRLEGRIAPERQN